MELGVGLSLRKVECGGTRAKPAVINVRITQGRDGVCILSYQPSRRYSGRNLQEGGEDVQLKLSPLRVYEWSRPLTLPPIHLRCRKPLMKCPRAGPWKNQISL